MYVDSVKFYYIPHTAPHTDIYKHFNLFVSHLMNYVENKICM